jgi:hypothetical protein
VIYKGGQGYLDRQRTNREQPTGNSTPSAGRNIQHPKTGRRVLRYSNGPNLSKFVLCPCVHLQVPDSVIPHQIITYLRVSLGRPTVKIPTDGAHHGADHRDHWANLKDLFININPLKVADCYFIHMHRRIDSSSSRSDPSANGCIDLDYLARLHLALQRRCTAAADLGDPVQLRLVPQCPRAAATSSTTSTSRGRSAARRQLHQLLVST